MFKSRLLLLLLLLLISCSWLYSSVILQGARFYFRDREEKVGVEKVGVEKDRVLSKLRLKAGGVREFAEKNNYNKTICFLIDMSLPSGQNRFFVYNLKKDTLQNSGLVTHGRCNQEWLKGRKYGNTVGCGCTSIGRYRIGAAYKGKFGLAFKLYGLDKTNDKAFSRFVVLHAHDCVPETPIDDDICQSDGCPTVAPGFLKQLQPIIQASSRPVLLWIFE